MKEVDILFEGEALTVDELRKILNNLPDDMVVADFFNDAITEVTRVSILIQPIENEEYLIIG